MMCYHLLHWCSMKNTAEYHRPLSSRVGSGLEHKSLTAGESLWI